MRRKLYTRVSNELARMDTPYLCVRDSYTTAGTGRKMVDVQRGRPGRIQVSFIQDRKIKTRVYRNIKALRDIKEYLK